MPLRRFSSGETLMKRVEIDHHCILPFDKIFGKVSLANFICRFYLLADCQRMVIEIPLTHEIDSATSI